MKVQRLLTLKTDYVIVLIETIRLNCSFDLTENVVMWLVYYKSLSVHNTNCIRTKEQRRDSEDKFAFFVVQANKNANLSSQPQPPDPKRLCDRSPSEARLCSQDLIQSGLLRLRLRSRRSYESGLTEQ